MRKLRWRGGRVGGTRKWRVGIEVEYAAKQALQPLKGLGSPKAVLGPLPRASRPFLSASTTLHAQCASYATWHTPANWMPILPVVRVRLLRRRLARRDACHALG